MKRSHNKLLLLLERIPQYNISSSRSELAKIISEYESILDELFHSKIPGIRKNLELAKHAKTDWEKDIAFLNAVKALKSEMKALTRLIVPEKLSA